MIHDISSSLTLLNVGLAQHQADWNWHNVRSPFARIYYVTEGHARVLLPNKTLRLVAGRLYLIPPFTSHHYVCDGRFKHYYVHFYEQKNATQQGIFDEWEMPYETQAQSGELGMMKHLCQLRPNLRLSNPDPDAYDNHATLMNILDEEARRPLHERMEVQGILLVLLSRFLRHARQRLLSQDHRIQQALTYIQQHLGHRIELDTLAAETCVSKDHLIRIFRQATGETPANYITRRKLEQAELLLTTTSVPVKNIASALGYEDTSYFIRVFRRHSNMTPQEYRNTRQ
ncbi:MAG: helix-turn-helix domain-containing protein [Prevotella sp.]|nr:helix-turn-helix domain-containing protein [Prevotella sp.]